MGVLKVIKTAEAYFRQRVLAFDPGPFGKEKGISNAKGLGLRLQMDVLTTLHDRANQLFPLMRDHVFDHEFLAESDHVTNIFRELTKIYLNIRLFTYGRYYTANTRKGNTNRHLLTKQILFSNM